VVVAAEAAEDEEVEVGLYKLNPVYPQLGSAWFPWNLLRDKLVSIFAFSNST
jgi:hypothetical protein